MNKIRALLGKFASDEIAEAVYLLRRFPKDERSLALLSKLPKTERVEKEVEFLTRRCDRMREALSSSPTRGRFPSPSSRHNEPRGIKRAFSR